MTPQKTTVESLAARTKSTPSDGCYCGHCSDCRAAAAVFWRWYFGALLLLAIVLAAVI